VNEITGKIIGAAIEVHRALGPGLLESAYQQCLCRELSLRSIPFARQLSLPIEYKGMKLDCAYRVDLLVDDVIVEVKSISEIAPIHEAQLLTYMKLGHWRLGLQVDSLISVSSVPLW